jgi:very-short-patch-repair endonuclease
VALKFRRQQAIGPYVADFFCPSAGVVVELDGGSHNDRQAADRERQDYIESQGCRVIRFNDDDVLAKLDEVVAAIERACLQ